jgi:2-(1,2-epoxy-1,2-dihydrophenyl)acetyl-CoA isomerase
MTETTVLFDVDGSVASLTLNRPSRGNAIDLQLATDLEAAFSACEQTKGLRAIILKGAGKLFCSGGDLAAIAAEGAGAALYVRRLLTHLHGALLAMARIPVPVVAAVRGAAAGAGMSLACAADLAIATRSARFVMAYPRVGLTPDGSASWYLPRLVGQRRALELSLLSNEIPAEKAREWGMLNDVVEDDAIDTALANLIAQLVKSPVAALGGAKRLMRDSISNSLEQQLSQEMETICAALETEDARNGLAAFLVRRKTDA